MEDRKESTVGKRIAYIRSSNIYSDSRATKEIRALLNSGCSVTVILWNRDGKEAEMSRRMFADYIESGQLCCVMFNKTIGGKIGKGNAHRFFEWLIWLRKTFKALGRFDAVHACNLDGALSIWNYAGRKKCRLVYDIYDYYADSHNMPKPLRAIIRKIETGIINKSDLAIICTEERIEQIGKASPKKLIVLHNSPDISSEEVCDEPSDDYIYCGVLSNDRLLKEIFDKYPENSDLKFAVAGYGLHYELALEMSKTYENFTFYGTLPYDEVIRAENGAKVISAIYAPTNINNRLCAPNKFYEAMALGKPQIVCRGTGIDKIVENEEIGIAIEYKAEQFYSALRKLTDNPAVRDEMGQRAKKLYDEKYSWTIMEKRLLDAYSLLLT